MNVQGLRADYWACFTGAQHERGEVRTILLRWAERTRRALEQIGERP